MRWTGYSLLAVASGLDAASAAVLDARTTPAPVPTTTVEPDWFQTRPQSYQGVTLTGSAPMLAETDPVSFKGQKTVVLSDPLQTNAPIQGARGRNIFHLMGNLSPYFSSEEGFGVDEYPLPDGANISQVHLIHRHGSRYPSDSEPIAEFAHRIENFTAQGNKFSGALSFLNEYSWRQGVNILVPKGRQELFDSGVQHYYNYGALYNNNASSKLVVRSTTSDRALKSAENFLAGFFGLEWRDNANILLLLSGAFNSSLTGMGACANSAKVFSSLENDAMREWQSIYLRERTEHLRTLSGSFNWTVADSADAQSLCAYETVSFGYSPFCELFTYKEWEGNSYSSSIMSSSLMGFGSPISRASGIAWVEEFIARVERRPFDVAPGLTSANLTLNTNPVTFPLDQALYFDFGHDASIMAALSAFGITQFAEELPASGPPRDQQFHASRVTPFAGRLNIEIIDAPHAVKAKRGGRRGQSDSSPYVKGTGKTRYVHFMLNQRTVPLHKSFEECETRDDGWCELSTFLEVQKGSLEKAQFKYSCEGDWEMGEYGSVTDGVPAEQ